MIMLNSAKTCAFTGHRILESDFNKNKLKKEIVKAIENGYDTFLSGMALGFDTVAFETVVGLKKKYDIKIVACIPCEEQSNSFKKEDKEKYEKLLKKADEKIIISEKYTKGCMMKRNKFMVDNSSKIISYLRQNKGGTFNTLKLAEKNGLSIVGI